MAAQFEVLELALLEQFRELGKEDGKNLLTDLIKIYSEQTPGRFERMNEALNKLDWETVVRESHTLKSSSLCLGAKQLSGMCKIIELTARQKIADKNLQADSALLDTVQKLPSEYEKVVQELKLLVDEGQGFFDT